MLNLVVFRIFDVACGSSSFFGFPTWYKYLPQSSESVTSGLGVSQTCAVHFNSLNDIWLIAAAVIEILLRIGVLVSIAFVVMGGVKYITSQGEPDKLGKALQTVIHALVGLAITITAAAVISFIAGRLL